MAIVLGLAAAVTYGTADFIGGLVTKRNPVLTVVLLSQAIGFAALLVVLPLLPSGELTARVWMWGGLSGAAGAVGLSFLLLGLARGRMSVVAPVTAVVAAALPVVFGLLIGERPSAVQMTGVAVAIFAVALVSASRDPAKGPGRSMVSLRIRLVEAGVPLALISGVAIAAFLILIDRAGPEAAVWPLVAARVVSITSFAVALVVTRTTVRPDRGTGRGITASGLLDVAANVLFVLANRLGLLSIVAVLISLYPASTVLLARMILRERLSRGQVLGLALALLGIVLITGG